MGALPEIDPAVLAGRIDFAAGRWAPELYPLLCDQLNLGVIVLGPQGELVLANDWIRAFFAPFTLDPADPGAMAVDWARIAHPDGSPVQPGTLPLERCMATGQPV